VALSNKPRKGNQKNKPDLSSDKKAKDKIIPKEESEVYSNSSVVKPTNKLFYLILLT